jgi:antitoxin CptB
MKHVVQPLHDLSMEMSMSAEVEFKRLFWHSRRGMLELDVLLGPFLEEAYRDLDAADQARYRKLLDCEDQDMFGWFMQRGEPDDPDLKRIVRMILDRVQPN